MVSRLETVLQFAAENPDEPMPQYMAGNELLNAGQPDRAIEFLRRYVDMLRGGDVGAAYRLMGRAYLALGDGDGARRSFADGMRAALAHGHRDLAASLQEELGAI